MTMQNLLFSCLVCLADKVTTEMKKKRNNLISGNRPIALSKHTQTHTYTYVC